MLGLVQFGRIRTERVAYLLLFLPALGSGRWAALCGWRGLLQSRIRGNPAHMGAGSNQLLHRSGDLSIQLPGPSADAFVATALSRWTSIATAAISATHAGTACRRREWKQRSANPDGTVNLPPDIQPTAISQPVAIVYDAGGAITDALMGQGASNPSFCSSYSVLGGPDNLTADAHLAHALVILNGNCAQTSAQLPDLQYHLVRTLGRVLGLDWSQVNINVVTGNPAAAAPDYAGFPVMHAVDPAFCVPVAKCYPATVDPAQPKMDDQAALSRLYPVTAQNQSSFPGKQVFSAQTVRIHGTVYFSDASGQPAQPMQGVNVVARWVDPATGTPSRTYATASVSGFLVSRKCGEPGNWLNRTAQASPMTNSAPTIPLSKDSSTLPDCRFPMAPDVGQFQLTVEPVDPIWSARNAALLAAGRCNPQEIIVFLCGQSGTGVQSGHLMVGSAVSTPDSFGSTSYAAPAAVPGSGDWMGSLSPYGDTDYFWFPAQANRTLSVSAAALDEFGAASNVKAQPVVGIWSLAAPQTDSASVSAPALNTLIPGETRLDASINVSTNFRIGIADTRGDGRPDFRYHAHVFYGDSVNPTRASAGGQTPLAIRGLGFRSGDTVSIGGSSAPPLWNFRQPNAINVSRRARWRAEHRFDRSCYGRRIDYDRRHHLRRGPE